MREKATKMGDSVWKTGSEKLPKGQTLSWRENPLEASRFRHSGTWQSTGLCNSPFWSVYLLPDRWNLLFFVSLNYPINHILPVSSIWWWTSFFKCSRQGNTKVWHQELPATCWNPRPHEVLSFLPSVTGQIALLGPKISIITPPFLV